MGKVGTFSPLQQVKWLTDISWDLCLRGTCLHLGKMLADRNPVHMRESRKQKCMLNLMHLTQLKSHLSINNRYQLQYRWGIQSGIAGNRHIHSYNSHFRNYFISSATSLPRLHLLYSPCCKIVLGWHRMNPLANYWCHLKNLY